MSEMVARAAKALSDELYFQEQGVRPEDHPLPDDLRLAYIDQSDVDLGAVVRAVLMAIREPTEAMSGAGDAVADNWQYGHTIATSEMTEAWQAMIDAALAEAPQLTPA